MDYERDERYMPDERDMPDEPKIMLVYQVFNPNSPPSSGVYHATINGAIMFFLMGGRRGAYLGNMTNDWDNYKDSGWTVKEYELKEVTKNG